MAYLRAMSAPLIPSLVMRYVSGHRRWAKWCFAVLLTLSCGTAFYLTTMRSPEVLYTLHVAGYPLAMAVDQAGHAVVVGDNGAVTVLDIRHSTVLRTINTGSIQGFASVAVDARYGRAYISTGTIHDQRSHGVLALNIATGAVESPLGIGGNQYRFAIDERHGWLLTTDILRNAIDVIAIQTGRLLRAIPVGGPPLQVVLDPRSDRAAVEIGGLQPHRLCIVDTLNGRVVRSIPLTDYVDLVVNAAQHTFLLAQDRGAFMRMVDTRSGRVVRTVNVGPHPNSIVVAQRTQRLFIMSWGLPSVQMLDARTGVLLKTIALPIQPIAMAVDEDAGRLLISGQAYNPAQDSRRDFLGQLVFGLNDVLGRHGKLSVLDVQSGAILKTLRLGRWVGPIAVDSVDGRAVVTADDSLSIVDTHAFVH